MPRSCPGVAWHRCGKGHGRSAGTCRRQTAAASQRLVEWRRRWEKRHPRWGGASSVAWWGGTAKSTAVTAEGSREATVHAADLVTVHAASAVDVTDEAGCGVDAGAAAVGVSAVAVGTGGGRC